MNGSFATKDPVALMLRAKEKESEAKRLLESFQAEYPKALNEGNTRDILQALKSRQTGS